MRNLQGIIKLKVKFPFVTKNDFNFAPLSMMICNYIMKPDYEKLLELSC